jgi:hypothetical protein
MYFNSPRSAAASFQSSFSTAEADLIDNSSAIAIIASSAFFFADEESFAARF